MKTLSQILASLRRSPGFVTAVLVTFALGVGANIAVFSAAWTLLLSPLPVRSPDRVVTLFETQPGNERRQVAPANFLDWRREAKSLAGAAAWFQRSQVLDSAEPPQRLDVAHVSSNFFDLLGVDPQSGRFFHAGETSKLAVVSDRLWQETLGGGGIDGRTIRLDGETFEIAGVAPSSFVLPDDTAVWALAPGDVAGIGVALDVDPATLRDAHYLGVYARLSPGATLESVRGEMQEIARRLEIAYPEENHEAGANVVPLAVDLGRRTRAPLILLACGALAVLLVASTNVAGLLVARHLARRRQLAVRKALGAGTLQIAREVVAESALLALLGAALGLVLATRSGPWLVAALPGADVAGRPLGAAPEVVGFALLIGLAVALLTAVGPTLFALRTPASDALGQARGAIGDRRGVLRGALVVTQAAVAVVLIAGAFLLGRTLQRLIDVDPGFDARNAVSIRLWLPKGGELDESARRALLDRAIDAARSVPGVESAGGTLKLPLTGSGISAGARVEGQNFAPSQEPDVAWRTVTPGYFETLRIARLEGRTFTDADRRGEPVAIVNRTLAHRLWPDQSALGKRLATGIDGENSWTTVVGVVADTPQIDLTTPVAPEMYRPLTQPSLFGAETIALVARTGPGFSLAALERALRAQSPLLVLDPAAPVDKVLADATRRERLLGTLIGSFGGLALLLAGVGLHGVLTLLVAGRRRELGLRLAVGATAHDLGALVMRCGVAHAAVGASIGLVIALALGRTIGSRLSQVSPADPLSLGGAVTVLLVVALLASWLPARRAARIDPAVVLHEE